MLGITARFALAAGLLLLAACTAAPEAEPQATAISVQTPVQQPAEASPSPAATSSPQTPEASGSPQASASASEEPAEGQPPTALEAATTVMRALSRGDMETVAAWVHADKGVRFSPYAYVDAGTDIVLTADELSEGMSDPVKRVWREYAGSGEQIELTFAQYYEKFIYDADFFKDAEIALNQGLGQGTTVNNIHEVYPKEQYDFVEYHISGIDPSLEGMDWRSLRLVFEKIGQDHALVGIVHDQWTP